MAQVFSCEFCKITKNTFSYRTTLVAASKNCVGILILHKLLLKYKGKTNWPPLPLHPLHPEKNTIKGPSLIRVKYTRDVYFFHRHTLFLTTTFSRFFHVFWILKILIFQIKENYHRVSFWGELKFTQILINFKISCWNLKIRGFGANLYVSCLLF